MRYVWAAMPESGKHVRNTLETRVLKEGGEYVCSGRYICLGCDARKWETRVQKEGGSWETRGSWETQSGKHVCRKREVNIFYIYIHVSPPSFCTRAMPESGKHVCSVFPCQKVGNTCAERGR